MDILTGEEHADVITWIPHGKSFIIYKKKKFSAEVLPRYFKQSKFTSFTRKLNRWGFTRVTRGPETGSYYHKFFLRDQPRLCMQMSCQNARLQNESQVAMEQQMQASGGMGGAGMGGMMMPYGLGAGGVNPSMMSNPGSLMQMQLQLEQLQQHQQMQQHQQLQTELLRRAMASQASASATQVQLMGAGGGAENNGGGGGKNGDLLYMQMLAQSKASSMSAQPLMRAIQNSLFTNQGMPVMPQNQAEPERVIPRASAA